ncbi:MAG: hypothetical protein MRY72_13110 [Aquisalinus sp.]|nr:hypothetical protein [Aquisalinus sp.]
MTGLVTMLDKRQIRVLHDFRVALSDITEAPQNEHCRSMLAQVSKNLMATDFWHGQPFTPIVAVGLDVSRQLAAGAGKYTRSLAHMAKIVEGDLTALLIRVQQDSRERPAGVKLPSVPATRAPHEPEKDWDL